MAWALILFFVLAWVWLKRGATIAAQWLKTKMLPFVTKRQNWLADELTAACGPQNEILIASVKGDEAMRALSALDLLAGIPYKIVRTLSAITELTAEIVDDLKLSARLMSAAAQLIPGFVFINLVIGFLILLVPIGCLLLSIPIFFLGIVRRAGYWDDKLSDYAICDINVALRPKPAWTEADVEATKLNPPSSPVGAVVYSSRSALGALITQRLLQHSTLYQRKDIAREIGAWLLYDRWPPGASPLWPGADDWPLYNDGKGL